MSRPEPQWITSTSRAEAAIEKVIAPHPAPRPEDVSSERIGAAGRFYYAVENWRREV